MKTTTHIDWYSFTLRYQHVLSSAEFALAQVSRSLESRLGVDAYEAIFNSDGKWELASGRTPYAMGWYNKLFGVWVWYGNQSTALVEFTGRGTQTLRELDLLHNVVESTHEIATRIDVAIDLYSDITPREFVSAGYNKRISKSIIRDSKEGVTYEIGSRKSEKFCRVYRYNEPHPRSDAMRIEYECKKGQAKIVSRYWLAHGTAYVADMLTKSYKWLHEENPIMDNMVDAMPSDTSKRSSAKTLVWLITQVAPAFKRLVEEGTIQDPDEFIKTYFTVDTPRQTAMFGGLDSEIDV